MRKLLNPTTPTFFKKAVTLFVMLAMLSLASTSVFASISGYQSFAQSHDDTIVLYGFDGATNEERQEDKKAGNDGTYDLVEMSLQLSEEDTEDITYVDGFDGTSSAYVPLRYEGIKGKGKVFSTGDVLPLSAAGVTYEAILRVTGNVLEGASYAVGSGDGVNNIRGYNTTVYDNKLLSVTGDSFWNNQIPYADPLVMDHWYYLATTMSYDDVAGTTTNTTYCADLSAATPDLQQVATITCAGTYLTNLPHGIGSLYLHYGISGDDIFPGEIDQVTFYNGVKDEAFFDANLVRILAADVPEPVPGDANGDDKVDGSDVTILAGNWQKGVSDGLTASWEEGDFNGDGKVDGSDVTILAGNWQAGVTAAAASVPEPATLLMLLGIVASLLIGRRVR